MALLDDMNRRLQGDFPPPDCDFRVFLARFATMGIFDSLRNCFAGGEKPDILAWAGQCHVASFGAGRDFLTRDQMLGYASDASGKLFNLLEFDAREKMLQNAWIGPRFQIVLTFPDVALHLPLGRACFEIEPGALSYGEARMLLLGRDPGMPSLLERFSSEMQHTRTPYSDIDVWAAWYACIRRCIGGKPIREFSENLADLRALGFALRALGSRVSGCSNVCDLPLPRILIDSQRAFDLAKDEKNAALGWIDIANYHLRDGDDRRARDAYACARTRLLEAANVLLVQGKLDEANECIYLARDADVNARSQVSTGAPVGGANFSTFAEIHPQPNDIGDVGGEGTSPDTSDTEASYESARVVVDAGDRRREKFRRTRSLS